MTTEQKGLVPHDQTQDLPEPDYSVPLGLSYKEANGEIKTILNTVSTWTIKAEHYRNIVPRVPGQPDGWWTLVSKPWIPITDPPAPHPKSDAVYAIDGVRFIGTDGKTEHMVFVCGIPANGQTSRPPHVHGIGKDGKPIVEHYFIIGGSGFIGDGESRREMDFYEAIAPHTEHPITAGGKGLSLIILLENTGGIPDDQIHIRLESNQAEETQIS